jgi:Uncharacterized enzyme of phosphonate metabolism
MQIQTLDGGFATPPVDAAHAFRAIMTAMAQPGTIVTLAGAVPPAPGIGCRRCRAADLV